MARIDVENGNYISDRAPTKRDDIPGKKVMQEDDDFTKRVQRVYRKGLIRSKRKRIDIHLSELQQMNLELLRKNLIVYSFNAVYNTNEYNYRAASADVKAYGNMGMLFFT